MSPVCMQISITREGQSTRAPVGVCVESLSLARSVSHVVSQSAGCCRAVRYVNVYVYSIM